MSEQPLAVVKVGSEYWLCERSISKTHYHVRAKLTEEDTALRFLENASQEKGAIIVNFNRLWMVTTKKVPVRETWCQVMSLIAAQKMREWWEQLK